MVLVEPIYIKWNHKTETIKTYFMIPVSYFHFVFGMEIRKSSGEEKV